MASAFRRVIGRLGLTLVDLRVKSFVIVIIVIVLRSFVVRPSKHNAPTPQSGVAVITWVLNYLTQLLRLRDSRHS